MDVAHSGLQDFENQIAGGRLALFLPCLQNIQLYLREEGGDMQCKAAVEILKVHAEQPGLLDVKKYLKDFETTKELQDWKFVFLHVYDLGSVITQ